MKYTITFQWLFTTSEPDSRQVYIGSDGTYYERRYGLPKLPITNDFAQSIAWNEANRRGWFAHLRFIGVDGWPQLRNPEAQQFTVDNMLKSGTRFPAHSAR